MEADLPVAQSSCQGPRCVIGPFCPDVRPELPRIVQDRRRIDKAGTEKSEPHRRLTSEKRVIHGHTQPREAVIHQPCSFGRDDVATGAKIGTVQAVEPDCLQNRTNRFTRRKASTLLRAGPEFEFQNSHVMTPHYPREIAGHESCENIRQDSVILQNDRRPPACRNLPPQALMGQGASDITACRGKGPRLHPPPESGTQFTPVTCVDRFHPRPIQLQPVKLSRDAGQPVGSPREVDHMDIQDLPHCPRSHPTDPLWPRQLTSAVFCSRAVSPTSGGYLPGRPEFASLIPAVRHRNIWTLMTKFTDLKLDPKVLQAIAEAGYETPTPIQAGAIPPALEGKDVLGIAQTGTGKTASFTLPMITLLGRGRARARMPRSLVLAPTRELAAQVAENFDIYSKHTKLTKALLIGGVSFAEQDKLIDRGVDVLIATPGRLLDHFERGKLLLTGVQIMVVDEADRMLDMGFIPDIERIFQLTPFTRQTLFFSATMAPEIERITNTFLHAPAKIEVARQATTSETIEQRLIEITPARKDQTAKAKRELLRSVIEAEGAACTNAILFCNRKTEVDILAKSLKKYGFNAAPIHGDLDQSQRMKTLDGFRDGSLRFLVASDVAARGLDIPAVSHVFNFDVPSHAEDYVHRIGRTGRAGRKGVAVTIATPGDKKYLDAIESLVKKPLPRVEAPEGFELSEAAQRAPRKDDGKDRSRGRGRDRDERRSRPVKPHGEEAPMAPIEAAPVAVKPESKEDKRAERKSEPKPDRNPEPRQDKREGRKGDRRREDRDEPVVGMGDHVPDFLMRGIKSEDA